MRPSDLCSEQEISAMVRSFYDAVRQDEQLGPVFNTFVGDWEYHLLKLTDFWSSILLGSGRFRGTPMPKHVALPNLNAQLFERWLALFREATAAQPNRAMGEQAYETAQRIAESLWYGYQISRRPETLPTELQHG